MTLTQSEFQDALSHNGTGDGSCARAAFFHCRSDAQSVAPGRRGQATSRNHSLEAEGTEDCGSFDMGAIIAPQ
jgi:hypothetical protein